ncbi:MAG: RiPP maturation radical SAM C-methyltransferase [Legionellales bacterium]|nr:RiPP maturation radical SAM C-methyltransferase [Legionellales bacterium]
MPINNTHRKNFPARSAQTQPSSDTSVLFVNMPFAPIRHASIALGLIQAHLTRAQIACHTLNFNLNYAEKISWSDYEDIAYVRQLADLTAEKIGYTSLIGEWIFTEALYGESNTYLEQLSHTLPPSTVSHLLDNCFRRYATLQREATYFIDECLEKIVAQQPRIVGFTSVFQQHLASLVLAKRLKKTAPETVIIFGGANCEGAMGLATLQHFPFVDAVVSGECDAIIVKLIQHYLHSNQPFISPGVYTKLHRQQTFSLTVTNTPSTLQLDELPYPDYQDYFNQIRQLKLDNQFPIDILFESSRGCWWGEKQHCTFCGLNGSTMNFRSKLAERAIDEIETLMQQYPNSHLYAVDNIMDMKYFHDFIPQLIERKLNIELFYEIKANLSKDRLLLLKQAGIKKLQPGIESLSTAILKLMRKGVSAYQNIQLLKWSKEIGISILWNILWGFPQETNQDYQEMTAFIPYLTHLQPPLRTAQLRIDRFSPNFENPLALGFTQLRPVMAYHYLFPFANQESLNQFAYYFDADAVNYSLDKSILSEFQHALELWQKHHTDSSLFYIDKKTALIVIDTRAIAQQQITVLQEPQRQLLLLADKALSLEQLCLSYNQTTASAIDINTCLTWIEPLLNYHFLLEIDEKFLSLVLSSDYYAVPSLILQKISREQKSILSSKAENSSENNLC